MRPLAAVLAAVLSLAVAGPALGDEPAPDPTTAPVYSPTPGTVPAGALPPPVKTSARLAVLGRRRLVLDTRHLRTTVEVRCQSSAKGACNANGTLTITRHGHRTQIGAWKGHIPGQQLFAPAFHLTRAVRTLRAGHPIHGVLRLTNHAGTTLRATPVGQPITTIITVPVTIVVQPPATPPAPTVVTGPASAIVAPTLTGPGAPGTARVAGLVNPNGETATFHFEYGLAAGAYVASTRELGAEGDRFEQLVSATITSLGEPIIHYRLVATSDGGTTFGADQHFTMPFVAPPPTGLPSTDSTAAGLVALQVTNNFCTASLGQMLAGSDLTCTISVFNPQPQTLFFGATQVAVRPASEVLAIHAPAGMIGATTHSAIEPVPVIVPPLTTVVATAKFSILHAPALGLPESAETSVAQPSMATMPSTAHPSVHLDVHCTAPERPTPGAQVLCTITTLNTGLDAADFTALTFVQSGALNPNALTTDGHAPLVLPGGGAQSATTVRFLIAKQAQPGDALNVTAIADGIDETDLARFEISKQSNTLAVATRQ